MSKMEAFIAKLKEPSTIKGIIVLLALLGVNVEPEMQNQILIAGAAVYGLIQVFIAKG